jgi:hypothetical protein
VAVVGGGDADDVDAGGEELVDGVGAGAVDEGAEAVAGLSTEGVGAGAGAAGDGGELHFDAAEVAAEEWVGAELFEQGAVRFVENHAEADHADAEGMMRRIEIHKHHEILTLKCKETGEVK